jgi:hypothetical protein
LGGFNKRRIFLLVVVLVSSADGRPCGEINFSRKLVVEWAVILFEFETGVWGFENIAVHVSRERSVYVQK